MACADETGSQGDGAHRRQGDAAPIRAGPAVPGPAGAQQREDEAGEGHDHGDGAGRGDRLAEEHPVRDRDQDRIGIEDQHG